MKILIVDNEPIMRDLLREAFDSIGANVNTATDCTEAFVALKYAKYDWVILDICLPRGSGFDILEEIKKLNAERSPQERTNAIVMSGNGQNSHIQSEALHMGARAVFIKPTYASQIMEFIAEHNEGNPTFPGKDNIFSLPNLKTATDAE